MWVLTGKRPVNTFISSWLLLLGIFAPRPRPQPAPPTKQKIAAEEEEREEDKEDPSPQELDGEQQEEEEGEEEGEEGEKPERNVSDYLICLARRYTDQAGVCTVGDWLGDDRKELTEKCAFSLSLSLSLFLW